jgi:hypothetical protein
MIDIHADPGSYIQGANNVALTNAFKKLLNARPNVTIPFFFEKGDKKYMGRAKTISGSYGDYPTYYINFFELDDEETGIKMLDTKVFAKGRLELEEKLFDYYNSL